MALNKKALNNNPTALTVTNDKPQETQENPIQSEQTEQPKAAPDTNVKRKKGRPATKDRKNTCKQVSICLPNDLMQKWDDVKIVCGNNFTDYVTGLIEKDMDSNYNKRMKAVQAYKQILAENQGD